MLSKLTAISQQGLKTFKESWIEYPMLRRGIILVLLSLTLMLLSACGKECVVVDSPQLTLPPQYQVTFPPLKPTDSYLTPPVSGDAILKITRDDGAAYQECRNLYNAAIPACNRLLEK